MMGISELKKIMIDTHAEMVTIKKETEAKIQELQAKYDENSRLYNLALNDISLDKVVVAESVLRIGGRNSYDPKHANDQSVISDAIKFFTSNDQNGLRSVCYGVKDYSGFYHQRCDCEYGMGPRHGSVVFGIGLQDRKVVLTPEMRDACIYYLEKFRNGQLTVKQTA